MKTTLYAGKFLSLVREGRWEYAERVNATGAVIIVAVTDENNLLLVEQFRIPCGKPVIELPAGMVGDDVANASEPFAEAARRELQEETGYEASSIEFLLTGPTSAGMTSEQVTFVLASGLRRVGTGGGHGGENIQVHEVPLGQIDSWLADRIQKGSLIEPKLYTGLYLLLKRV